MTVASLLHGQQWGSRNAFEEEKYRLLAEYFTTRGDKVSTVSYCDENGPGSRPV